MDPIKPVKAPRRTSSGRNVGGHLRRVATAILALKPGEAINVASTNESSLRYALVGLEVASGKKFTTYTADGIRYVVLA